MPTTDRSDAIRRMQPAAWQRWTALGEPQSAAGVLALLTDARSAYRQAFTTWRTLLPIDRGFREAKAACDAHGRAVDQLMAIADALGATMREVTAALDAAN